MEDATIDLHVHTSCSDGDYSPAELINYAADKGIKVLAIADHDTVKAYNPATWTVVQKRDIHLMPAIELSTVDSDSGQKIHVVGLNIDINNANLNRVCEEIEAQRRELLIGVAEKLEKLGVKLRVDELLAAHTVVTKSHIGRDAVMNPDNHLFFTKTYHRLPLQGEFIEDYLIKGKPAFVDNRNKLSTDEAVCIIKDAGGVAICAHPSFNVMRGFGFDEMKALILRNQFDGVEVINIQYDKSNGDSRFDMVDEFKEFASKSSLLVSGGSDFHSENTALWGKMSSIGLANEKYRVTNEIVEKILTFSR